MFRDDTSRAFITGALAFGIPMTGVVLATHWFIGATFPFTTENVLGFALYYLFGGLLGMVSHFYRIRRIRFSVSTLLLIMFMVSLFATATVLARDRFRIEMQAVDSLQDSLGPGVHVSSRGWNYLHSAVNTLYISNVEISPETVSQVVAELGRFSYLQQVRLRRVVISNEDLTSLKAALPHVEFQE